MHQGRVGVVRRWKDGILKLSSAEEEEERVRV
jgi:hypothetical protein